LRRVSLRSTHDGLFAIAGSFVGGVIALVAFIRLVIHATRNKTPS
jgi:hypothetical protein